MVRLDRCHSDNPKTAQYISGDMFFVFQNKVTMCFEMKFLKDFQIEVYVCLLLQIL